jgi:hypothetical protein
MKQDFPHATLVSTNADKCADEEPRFTTKRRSILFSNGSDVVVAADAAPILAECTILTNPAQLSGQFEAWGILDEAKQCLHALREARQIWSSTGWSAMVPAALTVVMIDTIIRTSRRVFITGNESHFPEFVAKLSATGLAFRAMWRSDYCRIPGSAQFAASLFVRGA